MVKLYALGKKSNLLDFTEVGYILIVGVIMGFLVYTLLTNFSTGLDSSGVTETNYTSFIEGARDKTTTSTDWAMLAFLLAAMIFSIIMARKIPTEPLYIGIVLFLAIVFFIIAMAISNVYGGLMDNSQIASYMNSSMPITHILLRYFPFVTAIYEAVVLIVFFRKDDAKI